MKKKICMILVAVLVAVLGTSTYFTVRLKEDVRYELKRENEIAGGEPDGGDEPPEKKPRDLER